MSPWEQEQEKADFLEVLFKYYAPPSCCYTGLVNKFKEEMFQIGREFLLQRSE